MCPQFLEFNMDEDTVLATHGSKLLHDVLGFHELPYSKEVGGVMIKMFRAVTESTARALVV
jgi:hypothetical protein